MVGDVPPELLTNVRTKREGETVETVKFSQSAIRLFQEIRRRHDMEINLALRDLYEELGIQDRLDNLRKTGEQAILDKQLTYIDFIIPPPSSPREKTDGKEFTGSIKQESSGDNESSGE